jgi:hypothetical protein
MPIRYEIDRERGVIRTTCTEAVGLPEVLQHFRSLEAEDHLPDPLDVLLDLTRITSAPDGAQIQKVAGEIRRLLGKVSWGSCAIVASGDLVFGVSRILEVRTEDSFVSIQVFRDLPAAEAWLASERSLSRRSSRS